MEEEVRRAYAKMIADAKARKDDQAVIELRPYAEALNNRFGASRSTWESATKTSRMIDEVEMWNQRYDRVSNVVSKIFAVVFGSGLVVATVVCPIMVGLM